MINTPTVLVLGAGASVPYGFPTGQQLKNSLCDHNFAKELVDRTKDLGITDIQVAELIDKLRTGSHGSIDAMLEQRPHLIPVGKLAIALILTKHEEDARLLPPQVPSNDWYLELGRALFRDGYENAGESRLTIVTFNYDRSLERRLALQLAGDFDLSDTAAHQVIARLRIIHCHGTLGLLDSSSPDHRPFKPEVSAESLAIAARCIRIIHDPDLEALNFDEAINLISVADRVYFLGFGYHPLNMRRLGLSGPSIFPWKTTAQLYLNGYGSTPRSRAWLKERYGFDIVDVDQYYFQSVQDAICERLPLD